MGGDLSDIELNQLIDSINSGVTFLSARGETGGVLYKAESDQRTLLDLKALRTRIRWTNDDPDGPIRPNPLE